MRNLLVTLSLTLVATLSCVTVGPDVVPMDGPLGRQVSRVLNRHDAYVAADADLDEGQVALFMGQSGVARALSLLPEVGRGPLRVALEPIEGRHDAYVRADPGLDDDERATYLASTEQLGRLLAPPE